MKQREGKDDPRQTTWDPGATLPERGEPRAIRKVPGRSGMSPAKDRACAGEATRIGSAVMRARDMNREWLRGMPATAGILLSPCPGVGSDAGSELAAWRHAGIRTVLCLLEEAELRLSSYGGLIGPWARSNGVCWISVPLHPSCPGDAVPALRAGLGRLLSGLREGQTVLIHCNQGQVRTGCAAACLLRMMGWPPQQAVKALGETGLFPFEFGPLPLFDAWNGDEEAASLRD